MPKNKKDEMLQLFQDYRKAHGHLPAGAKAVAEWAIDSGRYVPPPTSPAQVLAEKVANALRQDVIIDEQGREVRAYHSVRVRLHGVQYSVWDDIRYADSDFMHTTFQQRRQQVVRDCRQLKADVDSYNDNRTPAQAIQLVLDFTADVAELEAMDEIRRRGDEPPPNEPQDAPPDEPQDD